MPPSGGSKLKGPRQRPLLPLRAVHVLKPPALPGDTYQGLDVARRAARQAHRRSGGRAARLWSMMFVFIASVKKRGESSTTMRPIAGLRDGQARRWAAAQAPLGQRLRTDRPALRRLAATGRFRLTRVTLLVVGGVLPGMRSCGTRSSFANLGDESAGVIAGAIAGARRVLTPSWSGRTRTAAGCARPRPAGT